MTSEATPEPVNFLDAFVSDVTEDPFNFMEDVIGLEAFAASSNPDIMYLHQARREPDWGNFAQAMDQEIKGQEDNGNWEVVPRTSVPEGAQIVPAVWALRRK